MHTQFSRLAVVDGVRRGENLVLGAIAGLVAAGVGAAIWMGITVATGLHVGYVALGVGALVGLAIRVAGNGTGMIYGIMGAALTFLGCLGGEILAVVQLSTDAQNDFYAVMTRVDYTQLITHIFATTSPVMYVIYAIGIFEGYKLSIRK